MTAAEFRAALAALGMRQAWLVEQLGVAQSTVSRWASGKLPIPPHVPFMLELLAERGEFAAELEKIAGRAKNWLTP